MRRILFILLLAYFNPAVSQTDEKLLKEGKWTILASNDTSVFYYDRSKVKTFENVIHTYVFTHNKEKNTRVGPFEFKIRCSTKESSSGNFGTWAVAKDNTFAKMAIEKLCGVDVIENQPPLKHVALIKQNETFYFLYSFMEPRRLGGGQEKRVIEIGLISDTHPPKDLSKFTHLIMSCASKRLRLGRVAGIEGLSFKQGDEGLDIDMPNEVISEYITERCRQNDHPVAKTITTSESPTPVKRSTAFSFEQAVEKCGDLGFTPKTEPFGKCVLQLTN